MVQTSIWDIAEQKKHTGIELVFQHANTLWKREAATRLQEIINSYEYFTSDDILMPLEKRGITTGDNRAVSAILLAAKRLNLIVATGNFVECQRKSRHHAPLRQWRVVR